MVGDEAMFSWQWCKHHCSTTTAMGFQHVLLNLDESFIGYYLSDKKGYVCKWLSKGSADTPPPSQDLNLGKKRTGLTYIGLIANRPEVQAVLPQILIGGAKKLFSSLCSSH